MRLELRRQQLYGGDVAALLPPAANWRLKLRPPHQMRAIAVWCLGRHSLCRTGLATIGSLRRPAPEREQSRLGTDSSHSSGLSAHWLREFGSQPTRMPLWAIVFEAQRP